MAEPWVLVDPGAVTTGGLRLPPDEGRHLVKVLRQAPGSVVTVCDGRGHVAEAVVRSVRRDRVEVEVGAISRHPPPSGPVVDLGLGVLHTAAMDWAIQKAVEVGVRSLTPLVGARSQGSRQAALRRLEHWRRVARQALKQCRRVWEMDVREPATLADLALEELDSLVILADPEGSPVRDIAPATSVLLLVGPEGGFDDDEQASAARSSWTKVRLGPHVMRAETAAVVGSAMVRAVLSGEAGPPLR